MNSSSNHRSMLKLEISEMVTPALPFFLHALRKNIATWILWARIWNFDPETSLPAPILKTRWKTAPGNQRRLEQRQSKSKMGAKLDILAHTIHVYTFLFKFLIARTILKLSVSEISSFNIDRGTNRHELDSEWFHINWMESMLQIAENTSISL